jgi:hypothetical protein
MKVMIDIETLSTESNALVLSIGAVKFTEERVAEVGFYQELCHETQEILKRDVPSSTLEWWSQQTEHPPCGDVMPTKALVLLNDYVKDCDEVWFCGPQFDHVILESLYKDCGLNMGWKFWQVRDSRTLDTFNIKREDKPIVRHNALDDAKQQALDVVNVFDTLDRINILASS